jgi:high-affinity Fe2+/Pb2+ permease
MKYTFHYKVMIFCTVMLGYAATESILEQMPTLAAVFIVLFFFFFMGTIAAPDNEKYK